ncbi:MAG TPA: hypothetical protein VGN86_13395 [Pyrinomonadaceae bacterium]|jgi:hypothetical protein|nr:hypothetical protein [Pyrinomonadaceae bacterium]
MKSQFAKITAVLTIMFLGVVYVGVEGKPRKMQKISDGVWGGQHIRLEVTNGSATIEYDCANGTINGPLNLDRSGKFRLTGTHVSEMGGPIRINQPRKGQAAQFTGWTDGKKMTLTVKLSDSKEDLGTFSLEKGSDGRLRKCK